MKKIVCEGSNQRRNVSDYSTILRIANCPVCGKKVKITIPDRKMHGNTARFPKHSKEEEVL